MFRNFQLVLRAGAAVVMLAMLTALPASAQYSSPNFEVINAGTHQIDHIYVQPHANPNWGPDLLGQDVLPAGYFYKALASYNLPSCIQDVRVIYHDGTVDYYYNLDVCNYNVTFHY
jgi:hypothetical protein